MGGGDEREQRSRTAPRDDGPGSQNSVPSCTVRRLLIPHVSFLPAAADL